MEWSKKKMRQVILLMAAAFLMLWAVINYETLLEFGGYLIGLIRPLLIGVVIAFILNVCLRQIETHLFSIPDRNGGRLWKKMRRPLSIVLSFVFVTGIIVLIVTMILPAVRDTGKALIAEMPGYWSNLQRMLNDLTAWLGFSEIVLPSLDFSSEVIQDTVQRFLKSGVAGDVFDTAIGMTTSVIGMTASIITVIFNTVVGIVFTIYLLMRKEILARQAKQLVYAYLPKKAADEALYIARLTNDTFSHFVTGQCTEAVIIGTLCFLGMSVMKLPYAPMISVLVGFTALIPVFGAFIGTAVGAFLILMISPVKALWFVLFVIVLQQIEGHIIYPKVVGSSVGLPALWVLLAVIVGGAAGGAFGMLVGVPSASVLYALIGRAAKQRLAEKHIAIDRL